MNFAHTLLDATVWRLGESGRPTALATLEIYRAPDEATLSYEFASLTTARFVLTLKSHADIYWNATGTDLKLRPLEGAPPPAKTAAGRLVQMRSSARRFSVRETIADEIIECRLLTQPIDRYDAADDGIVDGVIFAFANGTNPELGLVIETDGKAWTYGVLRLSSAATSLLLGEREVASFPFYGNYGRTEGAYTRIAGRSSCRTRSSIWLPPQ